MTLGQVSDLGKFRTKRLRLPEVPDPGVDAEEERKANGTEKGTDVEVELLLKDILIFYNRARRKVG